MEDFPDGRVGLFRVAGQFCSGYPCCLRYAFLCLRLGRAGLSESHRIPVGVLEHELAVAAVGVVGYADELAFFRSGNAGFRTRPPAASISVKRVRRRL